jgi:Sec-independent protein translocase protein TatA
LLILITPHVIRTPERAQEMTQDLKDSLRNVRPFVDEKRREAAEDLENSRKERYEQEKRDAAKTAPKKP